MKAIVYSRYGSFDDLEMRDIAKPVIEADEVLVRMRAAGGGTLRKGRAQLRTDRVTFDLTPVRSPIDGFLTVRH